MPKNKKNTFQKALEDIEGKVDQAINKAVSKIGMNEKEKKDELEFYSKSIVDDASYKIHSQGYKDKTGRLTDDHLKHISFKNSVVAAIIQTRQNQVGGFSQLVDSEEEKGWMIKLKNEKEKLDEIKDDLKGKGASNKTLEEKSETENEVDNKDSDFTPEPDEKVELNEAELNRQARKILDEKIRNRKRVVQEFLLNCGSVENRPFDSKKWNFDNYLRALVRDRCTNDRICTEVIPNNINKPHHFFPVDSSTIRFATPDLKNYKKFPAGAANLDFMYTEKQVEYLEEERDVLELDEKLLEADKYKYVQVIKGKIERAYTEDEMKVGMANITTDIYSNGYSISELELLIGLITSHINAEYYNQAYYTQGFSAKGILHIKAPIDRRKLESVRQQWHHMVKGSRNTFQTPIFAGNDEVNWIPLTQNHSDIEFQGWMNYIIKMICSIYQIDPQEIGYGLKEEGGRGGGLSGDNTAEKIDLAKDKGIKPLLRFLANYINTNIIDMIDSDFEMVFVGLEAEDKTLFIDNLIKLSKSILTLNEVRAKMGLGPIEGGDDVIMGSEFLQWYMQFSKAAKDLRDEQMQQQTEMMMQNAPEGNMEGPPKAEKFDNNINGPSASLNLVDKEFGKVADVKKSKPLKIEYYQE